MWLPMGNIIGVDEAGRGPVLGPLVVAGVKLESIDQEVLFKELGVRDSKKCTPKRREQLAVEIKKIGKFCIKSISAEEIDQQRSMMTLNKLEGELFAEVINTLNPNEHSTVFVDSADANEESFKNYVESNLNNKPKIISKHKADEIYLTVAAASILAKTQRDAEIERIGQELCANIGSGYPADPVTIAFLEKWIKDKRDFPPYTRKSWNTAKRLMKDIKTPIKTLDDFTD
jgi:ribonuclease HII